jgi:hypothetical protein
MRNRRSDEEREALREIAGREQKWGEGGDNKSLELSP